MKSTLCGKVGFKILLQILFFEENSLTEFRTVNLELQEPYF